MAALMITGGQDRRDHRPEARVRDRLRHLRLRIAHDRARAEPTRAAHRLVVPRGRRRRADPARDRRARRRQLPARSGRPARTGSSPPRERSRSPSGPLIGGFCTTYFSWRYVFAGEVVIVLVILLVTRRIADAPARSGPKLDLRRRRALRRRARADRLRRPQVRHLGLDPAEGGRPVLGRALADGLARPRGPVRRLAVLPLGGPARGAAARSRSSARRCSATGS